MPSTTELDLENWNQGTEYRITCIDIASITMSTRVRGLN